ncbi:hypothetical protein OSCI_840004 [Kamptonema sp. PCC 6506]|nr:hypothetical protein OSCI_840004 [Kamptonema sp. PCC 6506]
MGGFLFWALLVTNRSVQICGLQVDCILYLTKIEIEIVRDLVNSKPVNDLLCKPLIKYGESLYVIYQIQLPCATSSSHLGSFLYLRHAVCI